MMAVKTRMPKIAALLFAGLVAGSFAGAAQANVVYDLSFSGGGSGVLTLNFNSIAATENIGYTNIAPYFIGLSATVDGTSFTITPSNLASGSVIQTGSAGQLYTLTVQEQQPTGVPDGTLFLDLYTQTWQIHDTPNDPTVASGSFTISGPQLAGGDPPPSTPLPPAWTLMLVGLAGLGFVVHRFGARTAPLRCAG